MRASHGVFVVYQHVMLLLESLRKVLDICYNISLTV